MTFPAKSVTWRGWGYGAGLTLISRGWFVPAPSPPTPLPAPTKKKPQRSIVKRRGGSGGGGGRIRIEWDPSKDYVYFPDPKEAEAEADFVLLHMHGQGAPVKALADGNVELFVDEKGRQSIVLSSDDGTRYWYADVGASAVADGARVRAGQPIARTKPGAAPVPPSIVLHGANERAALPAPGRPPPSPKPAQVVFVQPPPPPHAPPRRFVKLVPIAPPPTTLGEIRAPEYRKSPVIAYVVGIGALVALLYALSRGPKKPKRRKR